MGWGEGHAAAPQTAVGINTPVGRKTRKQEEGGEASVGACCSGGGHAPQQQGPVLAGTLFEGLVCLGCCSGSDRHGRRGRLGRRLSAALSAVALAAQRGGEGRVAGQRRLAGSLGGRAGAGTGVSVRLLQGAGGGGGGAQRGLTRGGGGGGGPVQRAARRRRWRLLVRSKAVAAAWRALPALAPPPRVVARVLRDEDACGSGRAW